MRVLITEESLISCWYRFKVGNVGEINPLLVIKGIKNV